MPCVFVEIYLISLALRVSGSTCHARTCSVVTQNLPVDVSRQVDADTHPISIPVSCLRLRQTAV